MFEVKKTKSGPECEYALEGVIDENVDFSSLIAGSDGTLRINCKAVKRINSAGIRNWVVHFEKARKSGLQLIFSQLSPTLVEQVNFIPQLALLPEIESLGILFGCEKCDSTLVRYHSPDEAARLDGNYERITCPSCDHPMDYDDDPEETLAFLKK